MKILVVCLGNICRSPFAEGILKSVLPEDFEVDSAGTISLHEGEHPDKRAVQTAKNHGIDISKQRSRPITIEDFDVFDKILCMDLSIMEDVVSMAKTDGQRAKVSLFLQEAGIAGNNYEVFDPYWSEMDGFEEVFLLLKDASEKLKAKYS
ncbi:protein tyrosine phosphatase [Flavobacteriaceae bacterium 3519-10]|nr:protein tyrosine phosphatase [Flavobacteriaceae bacterium 3519-10]